MLRQYLSTYKGNIIAICDTIKSFNLADDSKLLRQIEKYNQSNHKLNERISAEEVNELVLLTLEESKCEYFALEFVKYIQPNSYHALGIALLFSDTLRSFFTRLTRYYNLISTMEGVKFHEDEDLAILFNDAYENYSGELTRVHAEAWAAIMLKLVRLVMGPDYAPEKVQLIGHISEKNKQKYRDYFKCPIEFDSQQAAIYFNRSQLDVLLPTANREIEMANEQIVVNTLSKMKLSDLPSQVYAKIIELLPTGECNREVIAKAVNMSSRSFHDKLKAAGTSYQEMLDNTRKQLSEQYLADESISTQEIAYLLGFNDDSNYSRAFKAWHGVSPRQYKLNKAKLSSP